MQFSQEWIFKKGFFETPKCLKIGTKSFIATKYRIRSFKVRKNPCFLTLPPSNWSLESLVRKIKLRINSRSDLYTFRLGDKRTKSFRISLTYWSWFWLDVRSGRCLSLIDYRYPNEWPWNRLFNRAFPSWPKV